MTSLLIIDFNFSILPLHFSLLIIIDLKLSVGGGGIYFIMTNNDKYKHPPKCTPLILVMPKLDDINFVSYSARERGRR